MLWVWAIVIVLAMVLELLTFDLAGSALAVGGAITFLATALGITPWQSVVCFALMGGLSLALLRPYLLRLLMRSPGRDRLSEVREPARAHGVARTRITGRGGEILTWELLPWGPASASPPAGPADLPTVWSAQAYPKRTTIAQGTPVEILYRQGGNLVVKARDADTGPTR